MPERVVIAMSGGVDSSVAAALAVQDGFEVIGVTLQLQRQSARANTGGCCGGGDIRDAVSVAATLGIPHYVLDASEVFAREVIGAFRSTYAAGQTPIPCVTCNETVKFRDLAGLARQLGAAALVTGHYATIAPSQDGPALFRGSDPARDQSYFLYSMTRDQLGYTRFPIGGLSKPEVRALAVRYALPVANKPDSQDICFVPGGDYRAVIGDAHELGGDLVDVAGDVIGQHNGISGFTVGQRRGLGVGGRREPLYVVSIDAVSRSVTLGPRSALGIQFLDISDLNWIGPPLGRDGRRVEVRVRSRTRPSGAWLTPAASGAEIRFDTPEYAVAPGQACVVYDGARVLGGGAIVRTAAPLHRTQPTQLMLQPEVAG